MKTANKDIAHLLRSVAASYELKGYNRFRRIAYEQAADTIEHLNREIYDIWQNGELKKVHGIGSTLAENIDEYFSKKGSAETYIRKQINEFPLSVYEIMKVPGLGAKRAYKLSREFGITDPKTAINRLLTIAKAGKISALEGYGERSQSAIITSIETFQKEENSEERMPLAYSQGLADELIEYMRKNEHVEQIDVLGSLRRRVATIGDIDLAVVAAKKHFRSVIDHFIAYPGRVKTESKGEKKASMTVAGGRDVDLRLSEKASYGSMLQYFTGSKLHNIRLREFALKKGYSLNEFGIKELQSGSRHKFATERDFYKFLGLPWIPPEIREGTDEIDLAIQKKLPKLTELSDIKGDMHIHSSYDLDSSHDVGESDMETLIEAAKSLNYEYIAITDHNPAQSGHTESQIRRIMKERYEYMKKYKDKFSVIISCEVDILPKGGIALPASALEYVDMILISIHSSFRQSREDMTNRILSALELPKVKVLAHPTARLLGKRPEIEADWDEIFKKCSLKNIAIEINAYPERLDLPDTLVREARGMGVKFTLGTDSHHVSHTDNMKFGVSVARRGGLTKSDIINTQAFDQVQNWIK